MEVSGRLEVHGTISGKKLDEFLPNPSLEHSKEILADCTFKELIVEGVVKVENSLNGQDIATILADVVYEGNNESEIVVTGPKTFNNLVIQPNTKVTSNYINDVSIDNIMTTINELNLKDLMDNVIILKDNEIINVNSSIFFLDNVYAELVGLRGNLTTDFMNGLDLNEWILSTYPIHKDVYFEGKYN